MCLLHSLHFNSSLRARNLCYSTLVNPTDMNRISEDKYKKSENGHCFVHSNVKKGILPTILEELLSGKSTIRHGSQH